MPQEEHIYDLADFFKMFGDSTRLKILFLLKDRELCVSDLTKELGAGQSAVSHQLRTLKQMKFVKSRRDGKNILYSLSDDHITTILTQGYDHIME